MILGDCCDTDVSSVKKQNPAELKILHAYMHFSWLGLYLSVDIAGSGDPLHIRGGTLQIEIQMQIS